MSKVNLPDIGSLANSASARTAINSNFDAIEAGLDNTLSRDGTTPNQMEADIDLNGNSLLNVADPVNDLDGVNKRSIGTLVDEYASLIATTIVEGTARVDRFIATAGQTNFTLTDSPGSEENMYVFDNGIAMTPNLDFHLTGVDQKTLSFFSPRVLDAEVVVRYVQLSPADGQLRADLLNSVPTKGAQIVTWMPAVTNAVEQRIKEELDRTYRVEHAGAVGDGVTDDYAAIQGLIDYVGDHGGGTILFAPGKIYGIGTGLVVSKHNVRLKGEGYQKHSNQNAGNSLRWSQYGGSILKWIGATAAGNTMLSFKPPATGPLLMGVGCDGIMVDGDVKASYGVDILSVQRGQFDSIHASDCLVRNIHIGVMPAGPWTSSDPRDTQYCHFGQLFSRSWTGTLSAEGILIDGDAIADTSICKFDFISAIHKDGIGLRMGSSDSNRFDFILTGKIAGGTALGVRIDGGATADVARGISIGFLQATGGMRVVGNPTVAVAPSKIVIDHYSLGNGATLPTIDQGSQVCYTVDTGAGRVYSGDIGVVTDSLVREVSSSAIIGARKYIARNSAGALVDYASIQGFLVDPTNGSEDGRLYVTNAVGGAITNVAYIEKGYVGGSPTGGDKGLGTINLEGNAKLFMSLNGGGGIYGGTGTPEGSVTAAVGSLYLRTDSATTLYVKQTGAGNTGWVAK